MKTPVPTRERGLKYAESVGFFPASLPFPTRDRGLKFIFALRMARNAWPFPVRGTWIEIAGRSSAAHASSAVPRAGNVD